MKNTDAKTKILIPEVRIHNRVRELAQQISVDYQGKALTVICVLKGGFVFFSDLVRQIDIPINCEFMGLSSYGTEQSSSGEVKITLDISEPLNNRHVLVIEDIVDTGLTLRYVTGILKQRGPASVRSCALLLKPGALKEAITPDYLGFKIGNEFVVGYGLDSGEKYRGLPYVGIIENAH